MKGGQWLVILGTDASIEGLGPIGPWIQLGATAVMLSLFTWIVMKRDPQERKDNRAELLALQATFEKALVRTSDNQDNMVENLRIELSAERQSRESAQREFQRTITEERIADHQARDLDRNTYLESNKGIVDKVVSANREIADKMLEANRDIANKMLEAVKGNCG